MSYVKTGPFNNGVGPGITANFLNALENVLEQVSAGAESGHYVVAGNCYASAAYISCYIVSLSRTSVPVSVAIDTNDVAPSTNLIAPSAGHLTMGGFQVFAGSTAAILNAVAGGNWTISF